MPKSIWAGGSLPRFPDPLAFGSGSGSGLGNLGRGSLPHAQFGQLFQFKTNVKTNLSSPHPSNLANAQNKLLNKAMSFVLSVAMTKILSPFAKQDIVHQCHFILCIDKWSVQFSRICTVVKFVSESPLYRKQGRGIYFYLYLW